MPIITEYEYVKPKDLKEALALKSRYGVKAKILAGGTDMIPLLKENHISPDFLIDIKGIEGISDIKLKGNKIEIGANITFAELIESKIIKKYLPVLWEAAMTVASVGVRNRATMAGNICSAVPCADSAGPLLVYDAKIKLLSSNSQRIIPIEKWFTGPKKTSIKDDEILAYIEIDIPKSKTAGSYLKLSRYEGEDLAQASFTVLKQEEEYKIAFASLSPTPSRAYNSEKYISGKEINSKVLKELENIIAKEISPISDIRATKEYRIHMSKVMIKRAIEKTISRYHNNVPKYGDGMIE